MEFWLAKDRSRDVSTNENKRIITPSKRYFDSFVYLSSTVFLTQNELPLLMIPKQYVISEQSMSRTENNLIGTVPSADILKPPPPTWSDTRDRSTRDTRRRRRIRDTLSNSAEAKMLSRTESEDIIRQSSCKRKSSTFW